MQYCISKKFQTDNSLSFQVNQIFHLLLYYNHLFRFGFIIDPYLIVIHPCLEVMGIVIHSMLTGLLSLIDNQINLSSGNINEFYLNERIGR